MGLPCMNDRVVSCFLVLPEILILIDFSKIGHRSPSSKILRSSGYHPSEDRQFFLGLACHRLLPRSKLTHHHWWPFQSCIIIIDISSSRILMSWWWYMGLSSQHHTRWALTMSGVILATHVPRGMPGLLGQTRIDTPVFIHCTMWVEGLGIIPNVRGMGMMGKGPQYLCGWQNKPQRLWCWWRNGRDESR